ncbi:LAMI_0G00892g1_1 [Lachancea mirantina]|uniref:LAMI_0G00892g1_1 n=1 Tax=Lachancea mirantina TaxID=1230905 RepID=A0A1G4K778_9SACH|nr:LAMI_0G00892g1_1 [Lachancea mirantina]
MRRTPSSDRKRHSMFLTSASLDLAAMYSSKNNRSADTLVAERKTEKPVPTRKSTVSRGKSMLRRSAVLLDDNMVREYNLAVRALDTGAPVRGPTRPQTRASQTPVIKEHEPPSCRGHKSSVSTSSSLSSSMSSLFSRDSSFSIHDLMYQDFLENQSSEKPQRGANVYVVDVQAIAQAQDVDIWSEPAALVDARTRLEF